MAHKIQNLLESNYASIFVDNVIYSDRLVSHLVGLASAIQNSHKTWRPTISELISLIPKTEDGNAIVAAGMAYSAAKTIQDNFPGPAILLYGAALNTIGAAPNIKLQADIT